MGHEHVLVVGGGRELPGLLRQHRPGTRTSVLCQLSLLPKIRQAGEHARVFSLPADSPDEEWIALARAVHERDPFTRLATFGERDQWRAAVIGAALGLRAHSPDTIAAVHDKRRMREVLAVAGVEQVRCALLGSAEELASWVEEHGGRWVVKPVDGSGSAGVALLDDPVQAPRVYQRCVASRHTGRTGAPEVLVEEYLTGPQISVEALSEDGEHQVVAVTRKYSDPVTFVELGHVIPAPLPTAEREAVVSHVARVLTALGIRDGVSHTELVLTEHGPRTIETHVRPAGDEIPYLVHDATGVDMLDCLVRQTLGEPVLEAVRERLSRPGGPAQAIWFGAAPCAGRLLRVDGLDQARALGPDVRVELEVAEGDEVGELADSGSRVLWARATGEDPETAVRRAREAVARCRLVLSAAPVPDQDPGNLL